MKKVIIALTIISFYINALYAEDANTKGVTADLPKVENYEVAGELNPVSSKALIDDKIQGVTESVPSSLGMQVSGALEQSNEADFNTIEGKNDRVQTDYSDWLFTDSVSVNSYIAGGENVGVKFNVRARKLELIYPWDSLSEEVKQAIERAPEWIRSKLEYNFYRLSEERRGAFAVIINQADSNLVDEIAFSLAYSSAGFLNSNFCFPELYLENAQLIYAHDEDLDYVEIVDYGVPGSDEDYYSTVKYWKIDSTEGKIQVEVPKEVYYMYVVHPKITDEIATYINPELPEPNNQGHHINNIAAPPEGVFWRDYLYAHTEEVPDTTGVMFPILKDSVSICEVIWDDNNEENQAVRAITQWVRDVMEFTSKEERPHQPVRIYDLHIGRCGEHEDLTAAASRACLIPCRGIDAHSIDHVWNEFWDERWEQWEPVNNAHKRSLAYMNWDTMGAVVARHSSGSHEFVTDKYNDNHNSEVTITALDASDNPIDGAELRIYSNRYIKSQGQTYIVFDTYGITDSDGKYTLTLGKDKLYYLQLRSPFGNNPSESNKVLRLNESYLAEGRELTYNVKAPNSMESIIDEITLPEDDAEDFAIKVNFSVGEQNVNWKVITNDLGGEKIFAESDYQKDVNLIVADESNYNAFANGNACEAYKQSAQSGELTFDVPADKDWYIFLNNEMANNLQLAEASFALYREPSVGVEDYKLGESVVTVYPNPFSEATEIRYALENPGKVKIEIYNPLGNRVAVLMDEYQSAGEHRAAFNAEGYPQGMYYYTVQIGDKIENGKILLVK